MSALNEPRYNAPMKRIVVTLAFTLATSLLAQAPEPMPLAHGNVPGEPHHHLKLENEYVRVYSVEVPPHENTQLHQHDHDYIYVTLGDSDVINAVRDKPEVHLVFKDGETHFTRGGFAHVARNLADTPFRNVTIELLKPQQNGRNVCREVIFGAGTDCPGSSNEPTKKSARAEVPLFETEQIRLQEVYLPASYRVDRLELKPDPGALVVSLASPRQRLQVAGKPEVAFGAGEVAWLTSGNDCSIVGPSDSPLHFLIMRFRAPQR